MPIATPIFPGSAWLWLLLELARLGGKICEACRAISEAAHPGAGGWRDLVVLGSATYAQNFIWQNSETLWKATIENCGASELAEINLASYLQEKGRPERRSGMRRSRCSSGRMCRSPI